MIFVPITSVLTNFTLGSWKHFGVGLSLIGSKEIIWKHLSSVVFLNLNQNGKKTVNSILCSWTQDFGRTLNDVISWIVFLFFCLKPTKTVRLTTSTLFNFPEDKDYFPKKFLWVVCVYCNEVLFAASQSRQNTLSLLIIDEFLPESSCQTPTKEIIKTDDHYQ